jgi:beta-glucosidase-like glycosyl hydrolase
MASSWDTDLVEKAQSVAAAEARAADVNWTFAPMVDIARDARWGRIVEGAGEDPYLALQLPAAQVKGFQGPSIGTPGHLLATVKHFAAYGAAEGGRDYDSTYAPDVLLWNTYFPPYKAAIDAGAGSVMSAYQELNDVPASGNRWLLHDVLLEDWKFKGFVVSDASAVFNLTTQGFARDSEDAAYRAFTAGVNMEMGFPELHLPANSILGNTQPMDRPGEHTYDVSLLNLLRQGISGQGDGPNRLTDLNASGATSQFGHGSHGTSPIYEFRIEPDAGGISGSGDKLNYYLAVYARNSSQAVS